MSKAEIDRVYKGERYSKAVKEGVGYVRGIAEDHGYEITMGVVTVFVTDSDLAAVRKRRKKRS